MMLKTAAGRFGTLTGGFVVAATVWVGLGGSIGAAPPPADPLTCLPSCSEVDGRMLVVAGNDDTTLAAQAIGIGLTYTQAGSGPDLNFELFDGDANLDRWDSPYTGGGDPLEKVAPELIIELYRDVAGVGGSTLLATWGNPASGVDQGTLAFTDNNWFGTTFPHDALSLVPGSSPAIYRYAMRIIPKEPLTHRGWNVFKVRAEGKVLLNGQQVFGFIAAMNLNAPLGHPDVTTIYPNINIPAGPPFDQTGSTYSGVWTFQANLPMFLMNVTVFDGDMDYGNQDCTFNDLDDPDSIGVPGFLLPGNNAVAEGVAVAESTENSIKFCGGNPANPARTGLPADDNGDLQFGPGLYERKPVTTVPNNVAYKLVAPDGQTFINGNPSGNREWEQFRIQLVNAGEFDLGDLCPAPNPAQADPRKNPLGGYLASGPYPASDCRTNSLPGGTWDITLEGMDLNNLNFWFFDFTLEPPDPHYSIGRLVWYDANSNGVQDLCGPPPGTPCAPELGIPLVTVTVRDGGIAGPIIATGITDANGEFLFNDGYLGVGINWPAGNYTVVVDQSNFDPGGALVGLSSTTGGEIEDGVEVGLPVCTDTGVPAGCGDPEYAEALFGYVAPPPPTRFIVIDEDSIDNGIGPNFFKAKPVNDQKAKIGLRDVLPRFDGVYIGTELTLYTGQTMDEGWFSVPTIPPSWAAAGPTTDGLKNFVGVGNAVGPGLGKGSQPEALLDKIPDVTPWNAAMLFASVGETFCAVVYDSDISINYFPLNGSLKGANLGIVAFQVLEVTPRTGTGTSSSSLPKVRLLILDANVVCAGALNNQLPN